MEADSEHRSGGALAGRGARADVHGATVWVGRLHAMGLEVAVLTGDNARTAQAIAG